VFAITTAASINELGTLESGIVGAGPVGTGHSEAWSFEPAASNLEHRLERLRRAPAAKNIFGRRASDFTVGYPQRN
jgi:hypothetical protein